MPIKPVTILCRICSPENTSCCVRVLCSTRTLRAGPRCPGSLTAGAQQITILDEYRTRPRGDTFDSKPHAKKGSRKADSGVESPRDNRSARFAGRVQDRRGSREKPRLVLVQRGRGSPTDRFLRFFWVDAGRIQPSALRRTGSATRSFTRSESEDCQLGYLFGWLR